ncbi:sugar-transfer associated ATP-grasp domain-containing protein [Ulvibacterium sp.]|uniref:sugar-transfer associated ATP-grasp domain-containing protein n=1 Tax=Ulvibacterium sp. TaxID=2665914 RepID=UPI003CC5D309
MKVIHSLKSILSKAETYRFHFLHKKEAKGILRQIEKEKGRLSPPLKKKAMEYAQDIFGAKRYAPWLYVYSAASGTFKEGWIPDNYYGQVVVPKIQGAYGKLSFAKLYSNAFFKTDRFPDLAYYVNGQWLSKDLSVMDPSAVQEVIFSESDQVVFKRDQSFQGKGVHLIQKNNFKTSYIEQLGNGVFQKHIRHHPFFNDFGMAATATLRITTVLNTSRQVFVRAAYLRMGRSGETHVQSRSQVKVGIEINTGELAEYGHLNDWRSVPKHPDTHMAFTHKTIPYFDEAMALCKELHAKVPYIGSIGWDLAIDAKGQLQILEWNGYNNDIKYSEATQGPCFADLGWEQLWKGN